MKSNCTVIPITPMDLRCAVCDSSPVVAWDKEFGAESNCLCKECEPIVRFVDRVLELTSGRTGICRPT